jgi:LemA protein
MDWSIVLSALVGVGTVAALTVVIAAFVVVGIYNRLVGLSSQCENAFAQIELQLKRRYDLIPNLVEAVKSYMAHEKATLESVIASRNKAAAGLKQATRRSENSDALQDWMGAEGALSGAVGRLTAVIEAYPNLKADASVAQLTEELRSTENRIAFARQAYNDWVTGFNTCRSAFPNCLFAGLFGFGRGRKHLEFVDAENLADAPTVLLA